MRDPVLFDTGMIPSMWKNVLFLLMLIFIANTNGQEPIHSIAQSKRSASYDRESGAFSDIIFFLVGLALALVLGLATFIAPLTNLLLTNITGAVNVGAAGRRRKRGIQGLNDHLLKALQTLERALLKYENNHINQKKQ
ncbi:uncharacterized protein LOC143227149 [Tachypleus tridentatus]|uniref:uncharacterized protein LOC143227149 n=1 Tax=Tachypleus tridentatus TaxID=6853 RepID=UPI003FD5C7B5